MTYIFSHIISSINYQDPLSFHFTQISYSFEFVSHSTSSNFLGYTLVPWIRNLPPLNQEILTPYQSTNLQTQVPYLVHPPHSSFLSNYCKLFFKQSFLSPQPCYLLSDYLRQCSLFFGCSKFKSKCSYIFLKSIQTLVTFHIQSRILEAYS